MQPVNPKKRKKHSSERGSNEARATDVWNRRFCDEWTRCLHVSGDEKVSVEEALKDKKAGDMARGREGIEQSRHFDVHVWVESKGTYRASG